MSKKEKRRTISSSESYDSNCEPIESSNTKKRSRIVSVFNLYATYENREKAVTAIRLENTWNKERIRDSKEGVKEAYQCKYSKCKKKCYLLFNVDSDQVSLWFNDQEHQHDGPKKTEFGMNFITKREIENLFKNNVKYPSRILYALNNMTKKLIPNPDKNDKHNLLIPNPLYVEGLNIPNKLQVKNFIHNNLKQKKASNSLTYENLTTWDVDQQEESVDEDESLSLDDFNQTSETLAKELDSNVTSGIN
jgi:hypothetical protein